MISDATMPVQLLTADVVAKNKRCDLFQRLHLFDAKGEIPRQEW